MAISDLFTQTMDGGDPVVATVSTNRSGGGTSLACDDLDNWPNDTVHYITYKKKASGAIDYDTLQTFKGIVSGNTIGTVTFKSSPTGSDLGNDIGDYVRLAPTASWSQDLFDGLTAEHGVDGTHNDGFLTSRMIEGGAVTPDSLLPGSGDSWEWETWEPTVTPRANMTLSGVNVRFARYKIIGKTLFFLIRVDSFTVGGTPTDSVYITLPEGFSLPTGAFAITLCSGWVDDGGAKQAFGWYHADLDAILVRKYDSSNWSIGSSKAIQIQGFYEIT